jgi:exosortase
MLLGVAFTLFSVPAVCALLSVYVTNPDYAHGLLVPVVSAVAAWRLKDRIRTSTPGIGWPGVLLLLIGCILAVLAHWYAVALQPGYLGHVFLRSVALWINLVALVGLILGGRRVRILAFPLAYLGFAVVLPESFVKPLAMTLQDGVSSLSAGLLRLTGIEVYREGHLLNLPCGVLGVAEACSGIRSLTVLPAFAVACAYFRRLSWRSGGLLLLLTPFLAVGSNVLRVTVSGLLASAGHGEFLQGAWHDALGFAGVALSGSILLTVSAWRVNRCSSVRAEASAPSECLLRPVGFEHWLVGMLLLGAAGAMIFTEHHYHRNQEALTLLPVARRTLAEFPRTVGSFHSRGDISLSPDEAKQLAPTDYCIRQYNGDRNEEIILSVFYWAPLKVTPGLRIPPRVIHPPDACYQGAGWSRNPAFSEVESCAWLPGEMVRSMLLSKAYQERWVMYWTRATANEEWRPFSPRDLRRRATLLFRSWRSPLDMDIDHTYGVSIAVETRAPPSEARQTAFQFSRLIVPLLHEFGVGSDREK